MDPSEFENHCILDDMGLLYPSIMNTLDSGISPLSAGSYLVCIPGDKRNISQGDPRWDRTKCSSFFFRSFMDAVEKWPSGWRYERFAGGFLLSIAFEGAYAEVRISHHGLHHHDRI